MISTLPLKKKEKPTIYINELQVRMNYIFYKHTNAFNFEFVVGTNKRTTKIFNSFRQFVSSLLNSLHKKKKKQIRFETVDPTKKVEKTKNEFP